MGFGRSGGFFDNSGGGFFGSNKAFDNFGSTSSFKPDFVSNKVFGDFGSSFSKPNSISSSFSTSKQFGSKSSVGLGFLSNKSFDFGPSKTSSFMPNDVLDCIKDAIGDGRRSNFGFDGIDIPTVAMDKHTSNKAPTPQTKTSTTYVPPAETDSSAFKPTTVPTATKTESISKAFSVIAEQSDEFIPAQQLINDVCLGNPLPTATTNGVVSKDVLDKFDSGVTSSTVTDKPTSPFEIVKQTGDLISKFATYSHSIATGISPFMQGPAINTAIAMSKLQERINEQKELDKIVTNIDKEYKPQHKSMKDAIDSIIEAMPGEQSTKFSPENNPFTNANKRTPFPFKRDRHFAKPSINIESQPCKYSGHMGSAGNHCDSAPTIEKPFSNKESSSDTESSSNTEATPKTEDISTSHNTDPYIFIEPQLLRCMLDCCIFDDFGLSEQQELDTIFASVECSSSNECTEEDINIAAEADNIERSPSFKDQRKIDLMDKTKKGISLKAIMARMTSWRYSIEKLIDDNETILSVINASYSAYKTTSLCVSMAAGGLPAIGTATLHYCIGKAVDLIAKYGADKVAAFIAGDNQELKDSYTITLQFVSAYMHGKVTNRFARKVQCTANTVHSKFKSTTTTTNTSNVPATVTNTHSNIPSKAQDTLQTQITNTKASYMMGSDERSGWGGKGGNPKGSKVAKDGKNTREMKSTQRIILTPEQQKIVDAWNATRDIDKRREKQRKFKTAKLKHEELDNGKKGKREWSPAGFTINGRKAYRDNLQIKDGIYYTLDDQHYDIEKFSVTGKNAKHLGSIEPTKGILYKLPKHGKQKVQ